MIYAEEIERAVLGACLLERTAQSTALKSLRAEMFYITAHRAVFEAISALYARGAAVDMLTVCEELRASGRLDEAGGPFAVAKLAGEVATSAHLEYHCTILFQYFLRRRLVEVLTRELAAANDMTCDVYDVLIGTQRELGALLDDSPLENHLHPMPEVMEDTVALVDRRQELSVNGLTGVPTGLQRLNEMTGGWQPGNLIFTAARPADGKTALDLFFARQAAMAGVPVVFFTLEMTASELGERMVLAESRADPLRIRQGKLTAEEVEDVHRTAERMSALPVHVDDTPYINVDQLCVIAKSLRAKGGAGAAHRGLSATACHGEPGAYARAGGGGVQSQAEGAGTIAGLSGHRVEPAQPSGGGSGGESGTASLARERGDRTGCRFGDSAAPSGAVSHPGGSRHRLLDQGHGDRYPRQAS